MINSSHWNDEYFLFLLQLYLEKPVGVKPLYSPKMVNLSMDLHIEPHFVFKKMNELEENRATIPSIKNIWDLYSEDKSKLDRAVKQMKKMRGFGKPRKFYKNVETVTSFEKMFLPVEGYKDITPAVIIMVFDLYPRIMPTAMELNTPEIVELASSLRIRPRDVLKVMQTFLMCDPIMDREKDEDDSLYQACMEVWRLYANDNPDKLARKVKELKDYFE